MGAFDKFNSQPSSGGGSGTVSTTGGTSTDNAIARFDGTTGGAIQDSAITVSDVSGNTVTAATVPGKGLALLATLPTAANGASQAGKAITVTASAATASLDTAGAATGGSVTIAAGAAARLTSGNAAGGDVLLVPGAGIGTGLNGIISIGNIAATSPGFKQRNNAEQLQLIVSDGSTRSTWWAAGYYVKSTIDNYTAPLVLRDNINVLIGMSSVGQIGWSSNSTDGDQGKDLLLSRSAAGVLSVSGATGGDGLGKMLSSVLTEDNTAGSGSPNVLLAAETNTYLTNTGASAQNYHTLPTPVAGLRFTFVVTDSDGIRVTATDSATIRIGGIVTAANGHIDSTTIGDTVTLVAFSTTSWVATSIVGGGALFAPGWTAT